MLSPTQSTTASSVETTAPSSRFKLYIVTEPFGRPNSGDSDYVDGITRILGDTAASHICSSLKEHNIEGYKQLTDGLSNTYQKPVSDPGKPEGEELAPRPEELQKTTVRELPPYLEALRKTAVRELLDKITREDLPGTTKILNLQLRPPESGVLLNPEDLQEFKKHGIKVVITCHEYRLNENTRKPHINIAIRKYLEKADHIIFFNEQDAFFAALETDSDYKTKETLSSKVSAASLNTALDYYKHPPSEGTSPEASATSLKVALDYIKDHLRENPLLGKTSLSQVATPFSWGELDDTDTSLPPLIERDIEYLLHKDPNIMWFGSIRDGKGFEKLKKLAEELKKIQEQLKITQPDHPLIRAKIIIAGEAGLSSVIAEILLKAFNEKDLEAFIAKVKEEADKKSLDKSDVLRNKFYGRRKKLEMALDLVKAMKLPISIAPQEQKLPIECHFYAPRRKVKELFTHCKYAIGYDRHKGFACNSSSMLAQIARGCVLFANEGLCTPTIDRSIIPGAISANQRTPPFVKIKEVSDVLLELMRRETEGRESNAEIFRSAKEEFRRMYSAEIIKENLTKIFSIVAASPVHEMVTSSSPPRQPAETPKATPIATTPRQTPSDVAMADATPLAKTPKIGQTDVHMTEAKISEETPSKKTDVPMTPEGEGGIPYNL